MQSVADQLESLRQQIGGRNDPGTPSAFLNRLTVTATGQRFDLDFYGDAFGECYIQLLGTLSQPDIAPHIRSMILRGPDEGANGTRNWDLEPLLATGAMFEGLESFAVQQNRPEDHNRTIIGRDYDEDGVLGRLLAKAASLRELTVPSAPAANFFQSGPRPLRFLSIDSGFATQSFIRNLALSSAFGNLASLEFGEYNETYMDDFRSNCTPLDDYYFLFRSTAFATVKRFVWRNPVCSTEEIVELKKLRPDLQMLVIRSSAEYV